MSPRLDVAYIRHLDTRDPQLAFSRTRVLGLLPALSHVGIGTVALDHQRDKVGKTESRHGVLLQTGENEVC